MLSVFLYLVRCIVPFEIYRYFRNLRLQRNRSRRLAPTRSTDNRSDIEFDYEQAIAYLVNSDCNETQIREGSMPRASLEYTTSFIRDLRVDEPLIGLHVGNFVGISLAFYADLVRNIHPESVVVSIDPNIAHRGIDNPQSKVLALIERFDLANNCAVMTGYSLEKSIANDGQDYQSGEFVNGAFSHVASCAHQLTTLHRLGAAFDFAVIDGNHEGPYLERELNVINELLSEQGILIIDDVNLHWMEIHDVFAGLDSNVFQKIGEDGRVGIARRLPRSPTNDISTSERVIE